MTWGLGKRDENMLPNTIFKFPIYAIEKFESNSDKVGKNNINKVLNRDELKEKPICSKILKIVMKNKKIKTNSKIINETLPKIL